MAANSSCLILIFELVLCLTTAMSVSFFELESIAKEVDKATKEMDLPRKMKDALSEHYINAGGYSNSFIELLDSYKTLSCSPVHFDDKEKSILTLSSSEDPIEHKVRAQLKYYRKMQEVQCTDYFILYYHMYEVNWDIQNIIQRVYNMIKMAYLGKFVVFDWLLKLHISLEKPETFDHEMWIMQLTRSGGMCDLEQYKQPLTELVNLCVKQKYLEDDFTKGYLQHFETYFENILEHDSFNGQLHTHFNNNESPLTFSVDHLYLGNIRRGQYQIEPITSRHSAHGWNSINDIFQTEIYMFDEQLLSTEEWIIHPFFNIRFQQMFLDIVRVKLYCFVFVPLAVCVSIAGSYFKYELDYYYRIDYFISMISEKVQSIQIEDKTLNEVLTLYSDLEKGKPKCEQCRKLRNILKTEIKKSPNTFELPQDFFLIDYADEDIEFELAFNLFFAKIEKRFLEFENFLKTSLDGMPHNYLLFFVNGSNNTELAVFPLEKILFTYVMQTLTKTQ